MTARDIRYGRRGNRWTEHVPIDHDPPRCDRCHRAMHCRQPGRHWSCADVCACHRPVIAGRNCQCPKTVATPA